MDTAQTKALVERAIARGWLTPSSAIKAAAKPKIEPPKAGTGHSEAGKAIVEFVEEPAKANSKPVNYCPDCGARLWPTGCRVCAREREIKRVRALGI